MSDGITARHDHLDFVAAWQKQMHEYCEDTYKGGRCKFCEQPDVAPCHYGVENINLPWRTS